ncbi:hypothetical protein E2320_000611 [Naja naja]|nr:hypothetical protein E2320_000611 [Naja naja]
MKLQMICVLFILLSATTRNLCAFTIQRDAQKDLASLDTYKTENMGLQEDPSVTSVPLLSADIAGTVVETRVLATAVGHEEDKVHDR